MSLDNEIIDKTAKAEKPKKKTKTTKKSSSTSSGVKGRLSNFSERFKRKKTKNTIGILLVLFSLYGFFACISYFFTWQEDQDQVINQSFFSYLFSTDGLAVSNWLGKFGAWISHLLMYRWFGIASLGIPFLSFLLGIKILTGISLIPIKRTFQITLGFTLWASMFLGAFDRFPNYLGGSFGFFTNEWFQLTIGKFGMILFLGVSLYLLVLILFNPNFKALLDLLSNSKSLEEDEGDTDEAQNEKFGDFVTANTIKDEQIKEEAPSEAISFDEDDEIENVPLKKPKPNKIDTSEDDDDDFEINLGQDEETVPVEAQPEDDKPLEVEVPKDDEELSNKQINDLQKEFGDYDPTLDLASYVLPPIELLKDFGSGGINVNKQELEDNKNRIVETLSNYKIDIAKIKATVGPTVTLYEIIPAPGVRISKIKNLEDDIALSLSALGIRIIAPIPGKGTIGIEVPNSSPEMVSMRSLIASEKFQNCDYELPVVMGKTITNETYMFDLTKMPHLLVAGATGQGKSVGLNAILISILYKKHPAQVKFVLIDPKKVELTLYNKIERHFLAKLPGEEEAIITDTSKVVNTLNSLCIEMDDRYELLKLAQARTIKEYNAKFVARRLNPEKGHRYMPYIVVLIDEFADLIMTAGKEVEHPIARIAQLARAVGIHLIVATQRPSVNVITGMIKANFPARIAFRVLSKIDSRTILDSSGADQLIGRGDMLISTGSELKRLQCGFVDTPEVEEICRFIGEQRAYPDALLLPEFEGEGSEGNDVDTNDLDAMFADAARIVVMHQQGSASLLQRKLKLGYNRAGRIVDQLEGLGIIGPFQGSKARDVLYADENSLEGLLASKGII
jgi:S-DNA-T family DNA segregation ATPase FtsK/SpoIIIE